MKKILSIVLTLVLTAGVFTGCGCTNKNRPVATTPTGMTEPLQTTMPTVLPTVPTTLPTVPTTEESTFVTEDTTGTTDSTVETRSRMGTVR